MLHFKLLLHFPSETHKRFNMRLFHWTIQDRMQIFKVVLFPETQILHKQTMTGITYNNPVKGVASFMSWFGDQLEQAR